MAQEQFDIQKRYEKKKEEERKKEKGIVDDKKKIVHIIKVEVPAAAAKPGPPLGSVLGQQQINTAEFCKEFNKLTEKITPGIMIPVLIYKKADKSFDIKLRTPTTTFYRSKFLKMPNLITSKNKYRITSVFVNVIAPKVESSLKIDEVSLLSEMDKKIQFSNTMIKEVKTIISSLKSSKLKVF